MIVHSAGIQDRVGARAVLIRLFTLFATLRTIIVDGGYSGSLIAWAMAMFNWHVDVVKRTEAHCFKVLPRRWVVERSFSWLNHSRRLSKDYEILPQTSEVLIKLAFIHQMLRRSR